MKDKRISEIKKGIQTAFIDGTVNSNLAYRPQLISNDVEKGKKVLTSLTDELQSCESFSMSVAFITMSGLTPLLEVLKDLQKRGVKGRILTTDYLLFSEPKALEKLNEFDNIELRMFRTEGGSEGFHTKGYIFKKDDIYKIIVGSANITAGALMQNKEWNAKVVSTHVGEYAETVVQEFEDLWTSDKSKSFDEFYDHYLLKYQVQQEQRRLVRQLEIPNIADYKLTPNSMQVDFIANMRKLVEEGEGKAMLISATGTGKTYASAFSIRDLQPKKMLFLVHREQIAVQAMKSFNRVFQKTVTTGILSGTKRDTDVDYLFSTMQMMTKEEIHSQFDPRTFDVIVIDEVHRAGAASYQRIMDYFTPKMWLGMTASPYRTDGFDIYRLFDHNIAHEITLQQALEEDLLCPFHYFGITDLELTPTEEGHPSDTNNQLAAQTPSAYYTERNGHDLNTFARIQDEARVDYIIEQAKYYGYSGDRVKGLAFCRSLEEAANLSRLFNQRGYNTAALSGDASIDNRLAMIERLVNDMAPNRLDYIFTVDIFNEGIDIPEVNQVLMLRPTESPTIFIQQLGRGLRKADDKEYVVIIDFIGNYRNNFMIPIALFGDRTYNKDNMRKYVRESNRLIPGCSSVNFDEISKERIYESIDGANFSLVQLIKEGYQQLKFKLGRIPTLMDFERHGSIDVQLIFDHKDLGSYYTFLKKYEKEFDPRFSEDQELMLQFISTKFGNGKRPHELLLIRAILNGDTYPLETVKHLLQEEYGLPYNQNTEDNLVNIATGNFASGTGAATYRECVLIQGDGPRYVISDHFASLLEDKNFFKAVEEVVDFALYKNQTYYGDTYADTSFQLYSKYSYSDVTRLLEWEKDLVAQNIGGYKYDEKTKTYPVFINYHKGEDISETINYEDRFVSSSSLIAISKSRRRIDSEDVQRAVHAEELGIAMHLFVRKNKDDKGSKEFYYLGKIRATGVLEEFTMPKTQMTAVEIFYDLEVPVKEDIYDYITN